MAFPRRRPLALNGKWLGQELTGTQRYATELATRILPRLADRPLLLVPADADVPEALARAAEVRRSRLRGTAFEQVALPWAARDFLLLSLGGPAPLLARSQIATMHDATTFRFPQTFSRAFRTWYRLMYRVVSRRAELVLTVSEFSRRELAEVLRVPASRFRVVHNGADHLDDVTPVRPPDVEDGRFALLVGGPTRHKNVVPVVAALADAGIRCVVVGGGSSARVFGAATADLAHTGLVTRVGRVSDAEIAWLYAHADVLVFPSLYEGFGLPVVEAQRLGCLVVASDRASLPEVAGDGAVLVDAADPAAVVAAVRALADDSTGQADLRAAGRRNAARFTWDASADALAGVLAERGVAVGVRDDARR